MPSEERPSGRDARAGAVLGTAPPAGSQSHTGKPGEDTHTGQDPDKDIDGDDMEDLEKIKADILKTLNKMQRAEYE